MANRSLFSPDSLDYCGVSTPCTSFDLLDMQRQYRTRGSGRIEPTRKLSIVRYGPGHGRSLLARIMAGALVRVARHSPRVICKTPRTPFGTDTDHRNLFIAQTGAHLCPATSIAPPHACYGVRAEMRRRRKMPAGKSKNQMRRVRRRLGLGKGPSVVPRFVDDHFDVAFGDEDLLDPCYFEAINFSLAAVFVFCSHKSELG